MRVFLWPILAALLITGCNNDKSRGGGSEPENQAPVDVEFSSFVIDLIQNQTSDQTDPVEINAQTIVLDDSADSFDELF